MTITTLEDGDILYDTKNPAFGFVTKSTATNSTNYYVSWSDDFEGPYLIEKDNKLVQTVIKVNTKNTNIFKLLYV